MITKETLANFDLFKGIPTDVLDKVAKFCDDIFVTKDGYVFREGERADKIHLLVQGSIALRVNLTSRPEFVTVSIVSRPYQTLGWSGVVAPNYYTASAFCEEDSHMIAIPTDKFMQVMEAHPEAGFKVMLRITEIISDRLRNSRQALLKTM
ncbi:MAG TPA: cyclic nucleotide-binding domain-containing protein [Anaerolineales bacterium]|nr:cyclic nucleotide-binding domain-containing protein [Anaerolineales bacterium]